MRHICPTRIQFFGIAVLFFLSPVSGSAESVKSRYVISGPRTNNSGTDKKCIANKTSKPGAAGQFFLVKCSTGSRLATKSAADDGDPKLLRADQKDLVDRGIQPEDVCTLISWAARSNLTGCPESSDLLVWLENEGALNQICKFKSGNAGPDEKQLEKICRSKGFTGAGYHFNSLPSDGKLNRPQQGMNSATTH